AVVFNVERHDIITNYYQCVTFKFFDAEWKLRLYNTICLIAMYFGPLIAIYEVENDFTLRTAEENESIKLHIAKTSISLYIQHRNSILRKTKRKTLKMTIIIVVAFIICWSPYAFMVLWYQFHSESVENVDSLIQEGLFIFAVANSCVNPFVYKLNLVKKLSPNLCVV
ncbi:gonadotropin-releasing hormone receptor-like protein, partial [Dinothrombium tinctorium]